MRSAKSARTPAARSSTTSFSFSLARWPFGSWNGWASSSTRTFAPRRAAASTAASTAPCSVYASTETSVARSMLSIAQRVELKLTIALPSRRCRRDARASDCKKARRGERSRKLGSLGTGMTSTPMRKRTDGEKGTFVREMFARIAPRYDLANRILTGGLDGRWRRRAIRLLAAPRGGRILDCCCGTGDLVFGLLRADSTLDVTGIDFCAPMLERAKERARRRKGAPHFLEGDVMAMPFADSTVRRCHDGFLASKRRRRRRDPARNFARDAARCAVREPRRQQSAKSRVQTPLRSVFLPGRAR